MDGLVGASIGLIVFLVAVVFAIGLTIFILYILTIERALAAVDPPLRPISPGRAWLMMIPLFSLIWIFFLVVHLRDGYAKMYDAGRLSAATSAGFGVGIAMAVCAVVSMVPGIGRMTGIAAFILWIVHWVQVSQARHLVRPVAAAPAVPPAGPLS